MQGASGADCALDACSRYAKEASSSFLKKRTKKLLFAAVRVDRSGPVNQLAKVFCFFFSKKKYFLLSLS
jgi:hypothetical protein